MAKYNRGFGVAFNDNDGGASIFCEGAQLDDVRRYYQQMGWLRARIFFARTLWRSLTRVEKWADVKRGMPWKTLRGWKP